MSLGRPLLKELEKLKATVGKRRNRLQFIASDTWDISDDLSQYSKVFDILEVREKERERKGRGREEKRERERGKRERERVGER